MKKDIPNVACLKTCLLPIFYFLFGIQISASNPSVYTEELLMDCIPTVGWEEEGDFFWTIYDLEVDALGNFYAAGTLPSNISQPVIAKLPVGGSWSVIGTVTSGFFYPVDLNFDSNNDLYVCGPFTAVGGVSSMSSHNIAKWDGTNWSFLTTDVNGSIRSIDFDSNDNLYAGGDFTMFEGTSANYVVQWDGVNWTTMGTGMNDMVFVVEVSPSDVLYAGGRFTHADGVLVNRIAFWTGTTWDNLSFGTNGGTNGNDGVRAITFDNVGAMYIAGGFTTPGNHVAKWDSGWFSFGGGVGGVNLPVYANQITVSGGRIYVGGNYAFPSNRVNQWNGSDWIPIGPSGLNGLADNPEAMFVSGDKLYVGGQGLSIGCCGGNGSSPILSIEVGTPPSNDMCSSAQLINNITSSCSSSQVVGNNIRAEDSGQLPVPSCGNYVGSDIWYQMTMPSSGELTVELSAAAECSLTSAYLEAYSGDCANLVFIDCNDNGGAVGFGVLNIDECALSNQTIYVRVWNPNSTEWGDFNICAYEPPPQTPLNDECVCAETLTVGTGNCSGIQVTGTNQNATDSQNVDAPSCGSYAGGDVWYQVTMPASGHIIIATSDAGGIQNTAIQVYSGNCESGLISHVCNTDPGNGSDFAEVAISDASLANSTLFIRVWEPGNNAFGNFNICAYEPIAPDNNFCLGANNAAYTLLPIDGDCSTNRILGTNEAAFDSGQSPTPTCGSYGTSADVWYKLTVPANANNIVIETSMAPGAAALTSTAIEVYSGDCITGLTAIECDNSTFGTVTIIDPNIGGTELYVRVWSPGNAEFGTFYICAWMMDIPDNSFCSTASSVTLGVNTNGTNVNATNDGPHSGCSGSTLNGVWYEFTAPATGNVDVDISVPSGTIPGFAVYSDCMSNALFCTNSTLGAKVNGLTPGQNYLIVVFTTPGNETTFTLQMAAGAATPANDECVNSIELTVGNNGTCPAAATNGTTSGANDEGWQSCDTGIFPNYGVWYHFTTPSGVTSIILKVNSLNSSSHKVALKITGYDCGDTSFSANSCYTDPSEVLISGLTGSTEYYILVWSDDGSEGDFTICLELPPPPPANDLCGDAITVTCGNNYTGSTINASGGNLPNGPGVLFCGDASLDDHGVWYKFVGTGQEITLDLCSNNGLNTNFDADISVYTGNCTSLSCVAGDAGSAACSNQPTLTFSSVNGTEYYIFINGANSNDEGSFELSISCSTPPPNDDCVNAIDLNPPQATSCSGQISATTANATTSIGVNPTPCFESNPVLDVWFKATIPMSGHLIVEATDVNGAVPLEMEVYSGDCNGLLPLNFCGSGELTIKNMPNQTVYIRAWVFGNQVQGSFDICAYAPPAPGNDDICDVFNDPLFDLTSNINGAIVNFSNLGANADPGEPVPLNGDCNGVAINNGWCFEGNTGEPAQVSHTIWYYFSAPASGNITIDVLGLDFPPQMAIWEADQCFEFITGDATMVGANDVQWMAAPPPFPPTPVNEPHLEIDCLLPGKKYYIQIDGTSEAWGSGTIQLTSNGGSSCDTETLPLGTGQACTTISNSSSGMSEWQHFYHNGNIVASLNDKFNNLGAIDLEYKIEANLPTAPNGENYLRRNWRITPTNQPISPVCIRLYISDTELSELGLGAASELQITKIDGDNCQTFPENPNNTSEISLSSALSYGTTHCLQISVSSFSEFYANASANSLLPAELLEFEGITHKTYNELSWSFETEINTLWHHLERSADGILDWEPISSIPAAGFSDQLTNYEAKDTRPLSKAYYRLKIEDQDGAISYSKILFLINENIDFSFSYFPNPAGDNLYFNFSKDIIEGQIELYNGVGTLVYNTKGNFLKGEEFKIDLSELQAGIYLLKTTLNGTMKVGKLIKE